MIRHSLAEAGHAWHLPDGAPEKRRDGRKFGGGKGFEVIIQVNDTSCIDSRGKPRSKNSMVGVGTSPDKLGIELSSNADRAVKQLLKARRESVGKVERVPDNFGVT